MIGIFDSGVGGLSVMRAIKEELPMMKIIYVADQAHVPYGSRSLEEIRGFSEAITCFLLDQGCGMIVVACNTASAAALHHLRRLFPQVPFVGMEPAVKPAAENTRTGVVGVLATPATFQGVLYASVVERFAQGVTVLQHTCPGLVSEIEAGHLDTPRTRLILEDALLPMLAGNIDTVVLGCTHYPFVIPLIQEIVGSGVRVIDPSPAIARQVVRLLGTVDIPDVQKNIPADQDDLRGKTGCSAGEVCIFTSGSPTDLQSIHPILLGTGYPVQGLRWENSRLVQIRV